MDWVWFHVFVLAMVYLDLSVFHRKKEAPTFPVMLGCSLFWVGLALAFNGWIGWERGGQEALTFLTAYVLEMSLSVDNLFVFIAIFTFFRIEKKYQHKVLFWGILGALVCRISFILLGITLLHAFSWMVFLLGSILIISAIGIYRQQEETNLEKSFLVRIARRLFPLYEGPHEGRFFLKRGGKWRMTTLFLTLFLIEMSDLLFAVDSVPAVLSLTVDPMLAYTSNVFAVLGLRSFYFFLASLHSKFTYLKHAIVLILLFVGLKMLFMPVLAIPSWVSLLVIFLTLLSSIFYSLFRRRG